LSGRPRRSELERYLMSAHRNDEAQGLVRTSEMAAFRREAPLRSCQRRPDQTRTAAFFDHLRTSASVLLVHRLSHMRILPLRNEPILRRIFDRNDAPAFSREQVSVPTRARWPWIVIASSRRPSRGRDHHPGTRRCSYSPITTACPGECPSIDPSPGRS
jgi:hypothetical protein